MGLQVKNVKRKKPAELNAIRARASKIRKLIDDGERL
jgi:hypothetical protein